MIPEIPVALTVRLGCELTYRTLRETPALVLVRPIPSTGYRMLCETYSHPGCEEIDSHGNHVDRVVLQPGVTVIRHDALVEVPSIFETMMTSQRQIPVKELPLPLLRYTLPSRFCDSDRLIDFARDRFDSCEPGGATVRAISDWVHHNIEYRFGQGSKYTSAADIISQGYGVCRDFAHVVVALCRTFNIPARYATSHLADIGWQDNGTPMDFHANAEVYLDHRWWTVDARFNCPRIGRVKIACGMDAAETALSTLYGGVDLVSFYVWNYQVDPAVTTLESPLDYSIRLDGKPTLNIPAQAAAF